MALEERTPAALPSTSSECALVQSMCVDSSSLTDEELEVLLSPPSVSASTTTRTTGYEAGAGHALGCKNVMAPGFSIGQAPTLAECEDPEALLSPSNAGRRTSGVLPPSVQFSDRQRADHGTRNKQELQSYRWKDNSCWLDSSLELIFRTAQHDWDAFSTRFSNAPFNSKLRHLYDTLAQRCRLSMGLKSENPERELSAQRDEFRELLFQWGSIGSMKSQEPSFVRQSRASLSRSCG